MDTDEVQDPTEGTDSQEEELGQVDPDSLAEGFLKDIPEADRNVVERYIKDWDGGVTRKFQQIHETYKPYKELGDVDTLKSALEVVNLLDTQPQYVLELLAKELGVEIPGKNPNSPAPPVGNEQSATEQNSDDRFKGLPKEFVEEFNKQQQLLQNLAQLMISQDQQTKQEQEAKQLDDYLGNLKKKYGDFDEEYVLLQMYKGVDGEQAAKTYADKFGKAAAPKPPPALNGGGVIPSSGKSVKEMSRNDVQNLVAGILSKTGE